MVLRPVDVRDVAQLGQTGEPRLALPGGVLVLLGRVPGAHDRTRHVEARVVDQRGPFAQGCAGLRYGPLPERLQLLRGEPCEVLLRRELLQRGHWLLDAAEVGVERALRWTGVDVHHRRDLLRDTVGDRIPTGTGTAVHREHDRAARRIHRIADRTD